MENKWKSRKFIGFIIVIGLMTLVLILNVILYIIYENIELTFGIFIPSLAGIYATYAAANGWEHANNNHNNENNNNEEKSD